MYSSARALYLLSWKCTACEEERVLAQKNTNMKRKKIARRVHLFRVQDGMRRCIAGGGMLCIPSTSFVVLMSLANHSVSTVNRLAFKSGYVIEGEPNYRNHIVVTTPAS